MSVKRRERSYSGSDPHPPPISTMRNGYSKPVESQSRRYYEQESPVIPDYEPPQVGRQPSHKRKESAGYYSGPLPQAPSYNNATLYRQRPDFVSGLPVRSNAQSKPKASSQDYTYSGRRQVSEPLPDTALDSNGRARPSVRTDNLDTKRGSISHRSPLQKLEVTLDGISKEEKRARVAVLEARAQERILATRTAADRTVQAFENGTRDSRGHRTTRSVSGPERVLPPPASSTMRDIRQSVRKPLPKPPVQPLQDLQEPFYPPLTTAVSKPVPAPVPDSKAPGVPTQVLNSPKEHPVQRKAAAAAGIALGAVSAGTSKANNSPIDVQRRESRKLQKYPSPKDRRPPEPSYLQHPQRQSVGTGPSTYSPDMRSNLPPPAPTQPDPRRSSGSQAITTQASATAGIGAAQPYGQKSTPVSNEHGFRLPHIFHRHQHDERRYSSAPIVSEWRSVPTAALVADDLDLTAFNEPQKTDTTKAWWEKSKSERRQSGVSPIPRAPTHVYDGNYDERSGQTYFHPSLYLKCGPLLRFRGISKETVRSARSSNVKKRDIWRGSVMIVTVDSKSDYTMPPTLRLFKQPLELLPPPPREINESNGHKLSPEYIDPIAGQVKMSRVGKTLYVRPAESLPEKRDLSRVENDTGLFEERRTAPVVSPSRKDSGSPPRTMPDGEKLGKIKEVKGARLFAERGVTFWKFNIEIELGSQETRIAYRINRGPAIGFWVPARGETMNIVFHSCNGFSLSVNPHEFSGPDPLWRDVLNSHQTRPFHVMLGGGDQIYNDAATRQTILFKQWAESKNPHWKHHAPFTAEMQNELEDFYLNRYAMWFSQGLFGMANSQIPMVNIWDDHDIIDGFGSYSDHTMSCPVFTGIGAVAFKYYMLFQHQSVPEESEAEEPSWLLGSQPGPYIEQVSRSLFMHLGQDVAFLGLDCRTERMRDEILSEETYERVFNRCKQDIVKGETKHLIVLLGVPIAYPRLNFLENILTSRAMDPLKALGRTGLLGGFVNKFDGGVEILDDLDDHWTAKHHKDERNQFVKRLQELAAEKSVRVTILGGDVHLGAVGQFYTNRKFGIPKDRDHRYMPNVISSAIVNTPPSDMLADIINKRNKVHHLDIYTDEDMIAMFDHDVDGKLRNNKHILPRRNWCSIRAYHPNDTPPQSPLDSPEESVNEEYDEEETARRGSITRRLSQTGRGVLRRLSTKRQPPVSFYNDRADGRRAVSFEGTGRPRGSMDSYDMEHPQRRSISAAEGPAARQSEAGPAGHADSFRPNGFIRRPTNLSMKEAENDERGGEIDLSGGLEVQLNMENERGDPAGTTTEYRLIVPALDYQVTGPAPVGTKRPRKSWFSFGKKYRPSSTGADSASISGDERSLDDAADDIDRRGTPLGGWSDRQHHISRKPVPSSPNPADRPLLGQPELTMRSVHDRARTRDSYPPATSASPKPGQRASRARQQAPANPQIAPDSRPLQNRWRGQQYDEFSDHDNTPPPGNYGASNGREEDQFAYSHARGNGYAVNGLYDDPGSPTQKAKGKRKSSWKFWRID